MPSGAKATANPGRCCQVQVVRFQVPGAKYQVPDSRCKVPGARFRVQSARCQIPGEKYLVPGEKIRGCHTLPQILRSLTHVDQIQQILQKIFYQQASFNFEEEIPMGGNVALFWRPWGFILRWKENWQMPHWRTDFGTWWHFHKCVLIISLDSIKNEYQ